MTRLSKRSRPLFAVLGVILGATSCSRPEQVPTPEAAAPAGSVHLTADQMAAAGVQVDAVVLREVAREVEVPGTVTSPDTALVAVGSLVEGRVESVGVVPGDRVAAGTPLLLLHSHELADAIRDLAAAEARLAFAEAALGRSEELLSAGALSREEEQRRRADRDALVAEVMRARGWVEHLDPDAEGHVVVRAPRAGTVFEVSVRPGAGVSPGTPLVLLGRTDLLWVRGWVPEQEGLALRPGAEVRVQFHTLPGVLARGRVVRMGGAVDAARRAVEIRVQLDEVPAGVLPGAFATLLLPGSQPEPRAVVPAEAVQRLSTGEAVFVEEGPSVYRAVPVEAVVLPDGNVAVDGLTDGMRIVVSGAYAVRSAMEHQDTEEEAP
ncbi:MAG: efflux RND transporter periplasmic adaptor subunit [Longimicrobiales bacterium]